MHAINFYYPNINELTRDELVEELRNAKNEILAIAMTLPIPSSLMRLPTLAYIAEHEMERLQGISTAGIDKYIAER
jgi:hypothetical protein